MSLIISALNGLKLDLGGDVDQADKLSCRYSVTLLVIFSVIVVTKQYVGEPINCWTPGTYSYGMRYYTDQVCWVKNTYYIPPEEALPTDDQSIVNDTKINYYQWVPIMLLVQALFFYIPHLLWAKTNAKKGCELKHIVRALTGEKIINQENRRKLIWDVAMHLDKYLQTKERPYRNKYIAAAARKICLGKRYGNQMIVTYFIIKSLYLGNLVLQMLMLKAFIGGKYVLYGWTFLQGILYSSKENFINLFPHVTLCSFYTREVGNVHRHTVQCVLAINIFNEKIYLFLWFWLAFVLIYSTISLAMWLSEVSCVTRLRFIKQYIKMYPDSDGIDKICVKEFCERYLMTDGIFLLRLLTVNINEVVLSELIFTMYKNYEECYYSNKTDV